MKRSCRRPFEQGAAAAGGARFGNVAQPLQLSLDGFAAISDVASRRRVNSYPRQLVWMKSGEQMTCINDVPGGARQRCGETSRQRPMLLVAIENLAATSPEPLDYNCPRFPLL